MIFENYKYIHLPERTCETITDAINLLTQNGKQNIATHVTNVAKVNAQLAERFGLDSEKCFTAGILHDISAVLSPADMFDYALKNGFGLCEAERKYPFLLHQRISKIISHEYFGIDNDEILSAIECHTTLKESASKYEMTLFIADKLAWDRDGVPPFYDEVSEALNCSLEKACYVYMKYMTNTGSVLCPHTNWNLAYSWLRCKVEDDN